MELPPRRSQDVSDRDCKLPLRPEDFAHVEAVVAELRAKQDRGEISESTLRAKLGELMLQDPQGVWWMVDYRTGEWHRSVGGSWVRSPQPYARSKELPPRTPATRTSRVARWAIVVSGLSLVTWAIASLLALALRRKVYFADPYVALAVVNLIVAGVTISLARRAICLVAGWAPAAAYWIAPATLGGAGAILYGIHAEHTFTAGMLVLVPLAVLLAQDLWMLPRRAKGEARGR